MGFIPYRYVGEKRKDTQEKNDNGKITLGFIPYRYVGVDSMIYIIGLGIMLSVYVLTVFCVFAVSSHQVKQKINSGIYPIHL
jgi:hypothetical protein